MNKHTRRNFVKTAAAASTLPLFNIRASGADSPNEKLNHASFGASGMAWSDISSFSRNPNWNLVAVAEVDENRLGKVKKQFPKAKIYKDWRELLDKEHKNLDSVNVSTPDHMHAPIGMSAMKLGLNLYGQKPLAQNLYEVRRMTEVANETGLVTQMGIQLSSSTYERLAVKMIHGGAIGKVKEVHLFSHKKWGDMNPIPDREDPIPVNLDWEAWCGVAPKRKYLNGYYHPGNWRKRKDYGTGTLGDMGCHIYSPMFRSLGVTAPISVTSVGVKPNDDNWPINCQFTYIFPGTEHTAGDTVKVVWYDGDRRPSKEILDQIGGQAPGQGNIFIGTDGVMLAPHGGRPKLFPADKFTDYKYPKFPARNHYNDFVSACRGEDVKPIADFVNYAGPLTETILLGNLASHFPNETLKWDAKNLKVTNQDKAAALVRRTYRKGWEVDGLS
jgi:predicted dehydrogenase